MQPWRNSIGNMATEAFRKHRANSGLIDRDPIKRGRWFSSSGISNDPNWTLETIRAPDSEASPFLTKQYITNKGRMQAKRLS